MVNRIAALFFGLLVLTASLIAPGFVSRASASSFPQTIALPNGFRPEGIVVGRGTTIYAGSIPTGAIYAADLRTGEGSILVAAQPGRMAIGLDFDTRTNYLYVAGGPTGDAYVYDAATGATIAVFELTTDTNTFVNDAIVTRDAVYFTDSFRPVLYRIALEPDGTPSSVVEEIPLSGDFQFVAGAFNTNGIEATADGSALIIVNSTVGALYSVDPTTGEATLIDLDGVSVASGDGILLRGNTLYVVQNSLNQIAVVELDASLTSGTVTQLITDSRFDVPTTIDAFGGALYVVNARFSTPPTPDTTYTIERVR
jgi:sugar lactone lactonase YvrE